MVTATETPGTPVANGVAKPKQKLSKNQLRRAKKKQQKQSSRESSVVSTSASESESESETEKPAPVPLITPDDVPQFELDDLEIDENDPNFAEYRRILDKFRADNEDAKIEEDKGEVMYQDDDNIPDEDDEVEEPKLSKKARKARNKLSVAELKVWGLLPFRA